MRLSTKGKVGLPISLSKGSRNLQKDDEKQGRKRFGGRDGRKLRVFAEGKQQNCV